MSKYIVRGDADIIKRDGKWYFLNETWSAKIGPYKTRDEARIEFKKYINNRLFHHPTLLE